MKSPWMNVKRISPKQMSVFKSSVSKVQKESISENLTEEDSAETDHTQNSEEIPAHGQPELPEQMDHAEEFREADHHVTPAEFAAEDHFVDSAEMNEAVYPYAQGKICFMTKKSPFSVHVEIDDFLHDPICGDIAQNTFEFHNLNNQKAPEMETKLLHTTTFYPEQPDCRLVCSEIHEMVNLTKAQNETRPYKGSHYQSDVVPLHDSQMTKTGESNHDSYMYIRVPVVLGEYKIEICLEENVEFKEEVMRIREITKEIVLTQFRFVPTAFSPSLNNGMRTVLKGYLLIEGYIDQKIEYSAFQNEDSITPGTHLSQQIVAELIVHILQVQQVRVKQ